jgi:hypothetical protein
MDRLLQILVVILVTLLVYKEWKYHDASISKRCTYVGNMYLCKTEKVKGTN